MKPENAQAQSAVTQQPPVLIVAEMTMWLIKALKHNAFMKLIFSDDPSARWWRINPYAYSLSQMLSFFVSVYLFVVVCSILAQIVQLTDCPEGGTVVTAVNCWQTRSHHATGTVDKYTWQQEHTHIMNQRWIKQSVAENTHTCSDVHVEDHNLYSFYRRERCKNLK